MKKVITTIVLSSILSTSVFAGTQSLAEIMANHRDLLTAENAIQVTAQTAAAVVENNISEAEFKAYLKEELSPRDYARVSAALAKGISSREEIQGVVANIGNGAQFLGQSCYYGFNQIVLWGGTIAAVALASQYSNSARRITSEKHDQSAYVDDQNAYILNLQNEINAFKNEGVNPNSYLITTRQGYIDTARLYITQSQKASDTKISELESKKQVGLIGAAVTGALTGLTALSCKW